MGFDTRFPDGRLLAVAPGIRDRLLCGVLVLDEVQVVTESPGIAAETADLARELATSHAGKLPSQIDGLEEARRLYKSCGMEPTRHRPSSESLLRRVLKGKDLYRINNAVDGCNLASLGFLLPIGMYDLAAVRGDVTLRLGDEGEEYPGIRKGMVHVAGRLGLFDAEGPFGSPTSDSARTCVGPETTCILAVIMATADYRRQNMARNLDTFADIFTRHCRARETHREVLGGNG